MESNLRIYIFCGEYKGKSEELLRKAIGMYAEEIHEFSDIKPCRLIFKKTKRGKPYLDGLPFHFSLSHTGKLWGCLVSDCNVGLDIQVKRQADFNKLAARFFLDEEIEFVNANGANGFFDIWTRKEACVKYRGTGLADIGAFSVINGGKLADEIDYNGNSCFVKSFDLENDVKCAYCSGMRGAEVWIRYLN